MVKLDRNQERDCKGEIWWKYLHTNSNRAHETTWGDQVKINLKFNVFAFFFVLKMFYCCRNDFFFGKIDVAVFPTGHVSHEAGWDEYLFACIFNMQNEVAFKYLLKWRFFLENLDTMITLKG